MIVVGFNEADSANISITPFYRWYTFDQYLNGSWGLNQAEYGLTLLPLSQDIQGGIADQSVWSGSFHIWDVSYVYSGLGQSGSQAILPYNILSVTSMVEPDVTLNVTNSTRDLIIDNSILDSLKVNAPDYKPFCNPKTGVDRICWELLCVGLPNKRGYESHNGDNQPGGIVIRCFLGMG